MRGNTLVILLSLAIMAGSTISSEARNANTGAADDIGISEGGGGRGDGNDDGPNDPGNNDESEGLVDCIETSRECLPPPRLKRKAKLFKPVKDNDCTCRPFALKVNNQTQIVLDCYETKMINGVERTRYCKQRPEIYNIQ